MSIERIVQLLESSCELDMQTMRNTLESVSFDQEWIQEHLPSPLPTNTYGRDLLHAGSDYEIVLATWPVGVGTPIHNHGAYSSHGMVRVLKGEIYNRVYAPDGIEKVKFLYDETYNAGDMIAVPTGLLHCMGNNLKNDFSMSLHVYSPRIVDVTYWDAETLRILQAQMVA